MVPKSGTMSNVLVFQEIEQLLNNKHTLIMEQNFNLAFNLKQYILVKFFLKKLVVLLNSNPTKALIVIDLQIYHLGSYRKKPNRIFFVKWKIWG